MPTNITRTHTHTHTEHFLFFINFFEGVTYKLVITKVLQFNYFHFCEDQ